MSARAAAARCHRRRGQRPARCRAPRSRRRCPLPFPGTRTVRRCGDRVHGRAGRPQRNALRRNNRVARRSSRRNSADHRARTIAAHCARLFSPFLRTLSAARDGVAAGCRCGDLAALAPAAQMLLILCIDALLHGRCHGRNPPGASCKRGRRRQSSWRHKNSPNFADSTLHSLPPLPLRSPHRPVLGGAVTPRPSATPAPDPGDGYAEAYETWRRALADYLRLARQQVSAARLRVAARAVHAAALRKGRLAGGREDAER